MKRPDTNQWLDATAKKGPLIALAVMTIVIFLLVAACGGGKYSEQFNDAERSDQTNSSPADVITFPDGFSNVATKCDNGNRVYVLFHEDQPYGGLSVVPNARGC